MKHKKNYTLILTSNTSERIKKISLSHVKIKFVFGIFVCLFIGFMALLTDYYGLVVNHFELTNLRKTNQAFQKELNQIKISFKGLNREVNKIQDFSNKIHLITTQSKNTSSYGQISSQTSLLALTAPSSPRAPSSLNHEGIKEQKREVYYIANSENHELIVRLERLKQKTQLVKQDVWDLYSSLLERKEILNNTPSIMPTRGWITSHFGYRNETGYTDHEPHFHKGLDIAANTGSPIFATGEGKVAYTGYDQQGYGKLVVIDHGYNLKTYYAHLSEIKTSVGTYIKRGEIIGHVGNTGKSTGPHLHYEVQVLGSPVNPNNYVLDGFENYWSFPSSN